MFPPAVGDPAVPEARGPEMQPLLEIDQLTRRFGPFTAVDGISFTVRQGEVLGFLGPNGAGKTTTMRMVAGYLPPTRGTVRIAGLDVQDRPREIKRRLGYLPEGAPLYGEMTVDAILRFVAMARGLAAPVRRLRTEYVVERLRLESVRYQQVETLSKGFKRRVGLALAILHDPGVLVLDEPTDGLDPNQKHEVRELIKIMASTKAIVISTHILEEVDAVCTRAMIIARGRKLADGTPADLMQAAKGADTLDDVFRKLTGGRE